MMRPDPAARAQIDHRARLRGLLQRIADALGRPVEEVIAVATSGAHPDETVELFQLWSRLGAREQAATLEAARIAARCGAAPDA